MREFDNTEELVNHLGDQFSSSVDLNSQNELFRTGSVVVKREKKCIVPNEIIELDNDHDDESREGPVNTRAIDSVKLVDSKASRKNSLFVKEDKNDVVPIETIDLDINNDDEEESIHSSVNMSDMDMTDTVEEKYFFDDNKGENSSSLNDVPSSDSRDISSNADFQKTAVPQGSGSRYYVNCEHCSLEKIRSDRYIHHCSKFHAEFFKDSRVECNVCRKLVHHVLTKHHAKLFHEGKTSFNQSSETSEGSKRWSFRLFFPGSFSRARFKNQ